MAEDPSSSHRLRWLVLLALLGGVVWYVRSQRETAGLDEAPRPVTPPAPRPVCGTAQLAMERVAETPPEAPAPAPAAPPADGAPAAGRPSPRPRRAATATLPSGSAAALPDGSPPGPEYTVKAKTGSELFHGPDSPYFTRTRAEFWFRTADDARAAGFTAWTPRRRHL